MNPLRLIVTLTAVVASLGAWCQQPGSPWPSFRGNGANSGLGSGGGSNGILRWQSPNASPFSSVAVAADGTIYVMSSKLFAFKRDGTLKWSFAGAAGSDDTPIQSTPAIGADGTIYFGSTDDHVYAVNPDGTEKWKFLTFGAVYGSPAFGADGTIYVGSTIANNGGVIYAINPDGTEKWGQSAGSVAGSPAVASDGTLYFLTGNGEMIAIADHGSADILWMVGEFGSGGTSSPAIGPDGTIYVTGNSSNLLAVNPDGSPKLAFAVTGVSSSPAIGPDGSIYVASANGNLYSFNSSGKKLWTYAIGSDTYSSPSIGVDGTVYVASNAGNVYAFESYGLLKWTFATSQPVVGASPAIGSDGTVYIGSTDLFAIGTEVNTDPLINFTISPSRVQNGVSSGGIVTLSQPAPAGGDVVYLSSDTPDAVVPALVIVQPGSTQAAFNIVTTANSPALTATLTATSGGNSITSILLINFPVPTGLTFEPSSVVGGRPSTGTVTLNEPSGPGGTTVELSSDIANAVPPSTVTVPSGATSVTFSIPTLAVATGIEATITAEIGTVSVAGTLAVIPPSVSVLTVAPASVYGGGSSQGTVTLNVAAPSGGLTVVLTSNSRFATVPSSVQVPSGALTVTFAIATTVVATTETATISAIVGGNAQTASLVIQAPTLQSVATSPATVVGGSTTKVVGSVVFGGPTPAAGATILLTSSNDKVLGLPASVRIPSGASTATFTVTHNMVTTPQTVTITAKFGTVIETAMVTVNPFQISSMSLSPASVVGGIGAAGLLTLNAAAGSGHVAVKLSSASKYVGFPVSVLVLAGSSSAKFAVTTKAVSASTTALIAGELNASSQQAGLTILPAALVSLSVSPSTVKGESSTVVTGKVTLSGEAPAGGMAITLSSSSSSAATVPTTVTIPAGRTYAAFRISHKRVSSSLAVTISASFGGILKTAGITITQ